MIDKFAEIPMLFGNNFIRGIFVGVAFIIFVRLLFKRKIETVISLEIIRWILISYSILTIISWLLLFMFPHSEKYAFLERATGQYAWAYWIMLIMNCVIPLLLINKKIGKNIYIIFLISLFMNLGWLFEKFVIIVTSFHRNYPNNEYALSLINSRELIIVTKGFCIGLISLIIGNGIKKLKHKSE